MTKAMKIQLTISHLESIIERAKENMRKNPNASGTVEIHLVQATDNNTESDYISILQNHKNSTIDKTLL